MRPEKDGFIWIRFDNGRYGIYFNLLPCNPQIAVSDRVKEQFLKIFEEGLADAFFEGLFGNPFDDPGSRKSQMAAAGWFPSPVLIPTPWDQMRAAFEIGRLDEVEQLVIQAVNEEQLKLMLQNWTQEEPFASDIAFFEKGIERYLAEDYLSAVSVMLPRLEGLINRALLLKGLRAESKLAQAFGSIESTAKGSAKDRWIGQNLRERFDEVLNEFFNAHFDPNDPNAPFQLGRHAHAHGVTKAERYSQRYALQVILAIDALFFVLMR